MKIKERINKIYEGLLKFKPKVVVEVKTTQKIETPQDNSLDDVSERSRNFFLEIWATVGPYAIWVITGYAEGYFFSGFRNISLVDPVAFLGYAIGFLVAALTLSVIIKSSHYYRAKRYTECWAMVTVAVLLSAASIVAQYMTLEAQLSLGRIEVSDAAIEHIPVFSWAIGLGGLRGHDWLFLFRSGLLSIGEFVAIYTAPSKAENMKRRFSRVRDEKHMQQELDLETQWEQLRTIVITEAIKNFQSRQAPLLLDSPSRRQEGLKFQRIDVTKEEPDKPVFVEPDKPGNNHHEDKQQPPLA